MNTKELSTAQFVDRFMHRIAIGVFLVALAYATSAVMFLVSPEIAFYLDKLKLGLGLMAVVIVFPQFVKMVRRKVRGGADADEPESFVVEAYKRAAEKSFALTFVSLIIMDVLSTGVLAGLPVEFSIEVILFVSLIIFSLSFFAFNRTGDDDDAEDLFDERPAS